MTADQLVEMDRLLEGLQPGEALVIGPDGRPWVATVTRYAPARHPWGLDAVSLVVPAALLLTYRTTWDANHWDGAMVSWAGRWFAATLVRSTPSTWDIANEYLAEFNLTPSNGPSLTPEPA